MLKGNKEGDKMTMTKSNEKTLPGNEHFKRYLEIAATGDLNILCVTPHEMEVTVRE